MLLGVVPPGRASGISLTGNTASFRASLWTNLEKLADSIYTIYSQVRHGQTNRKSQTETYIRVT